MPNRVAIKVLTTTVLATAIPILPARAQIRATGGAPGAAGIRPMPPASGTGMSEIGRSLPGFAGGPTGFHRGHSSGRSAILFPYPYYYSDYGYDSQEAAQPQVVVVPAAAPVQAAPPAPPLEPLLIEWQDDHFERRTLSQKTSGKEQSGSDYSAKSAFRPSAGGSSASGSISSGSPRPARKVTAQPLRESARESARELPPAILVFRDGRTEEVSSYTIMSGTIYSKADYWTSGSWTRKIQIADLDVPATLKLNHEHGLNFVLPAGPNEVVTRP